MIKRIILLTLATTLITLSACSGNVAAQTDLNGTSWSLTNIQGQAVLDNTQPSLSFENGQVSGSGSCNSFGGNYTQSGNKLTFSMLISTMMACLQNGVMDQEQAYLSALNSTATFQVVGNHLTLFDAQGKALAEFTRLP